MYKRQGLDSDDVIASLADMIDLYHYDTQILAASFKNAGQIDRAFLAGAHTATIEPVSYTHLVLFLIGCGKVHRPV